MSVSTQAVTDFVVFSGRVVLVDHDLCGRTCDRSNHLDSGDSSHIYGDPSYAKKTSVSLQALAFSGRV